MNWTKEHYNKEDWVFKNNIIETPSKNFLSENIMYDQKDIHKNCCFLHWPFWVISDITWYRFTNEERQALVDFAWTTPYADPKWWWYFWYWVKSAIDLFNSKYSKKWERLESERFNMKDFWQQFIDKDYSIIIWYKNTKKLVQDKRDDWILNFSWWEYHWTDEWVWHCTRMTDIEDENKIINNYGWYSNNIFWIDDYEKQIDNWMFFENWYVLLLKDWTKDWTEWFTLEQNEEFLKNRKKAIAQREQIKIAENKFT